MTTVEKLLKLVLYVGGATCASAIVAVFMPRNWMELGHRWLVGADFPAQPVAEYLARSCSALYALYGGVLILAAGNVRRYAPLITYAALAMAGTSAALLVMGGMPLYWRIGDMVSAGGMCVALLVLQGLLRASDGRGGAGGA